MTRVRTLLAEIVRCVWSTVLFCISIPLLYPFARARRSPHQPWVIGGHRGRLRADNSEALHDYLLTQGAREVVFITSNASLLAQLRDRGFPALKRNSLAARWAILKAPVLIYSHGEDDLDICQILLRGLVGLRVMLNHSMNYLKAGQHYRPDIESLRGIRRWLFAWLVTDFDVLLASSPQEKRYFELSYPGREADILLGGGAHIDAFMNNRHRPTQRTIVYFPTFRDDGPGRRSLSETLRRLAGHAPLRQWLRDRGYRLLVGSHINSSSIRVTLPEPMAWMSPADVKNQLLDCRLFISDYSGLIFDYLALDKPVVLFPFDLKQYLRTRRLYSEYDHIAYGPIVCNVDELATLIISGRWRNQAPYADVRQRLRAAVFPEMAPSYARNCCEAIRCLATPNEAVDPGYEHAHCLRHRPTLSG